MTKKRRHTQKTLIRELSQNGWVKEAGGKHQVKMVKPGERPITIPKLKGGTLPIGLTQAILKQAGVEKEGT